MKFSLDTNTCIRYLNRRSIAIRHKLSTIPARDIVVCSIVRGELAYGLAKSQTPQASAAKQARFLKPYASLPYDNPAAEAQDLLDDFGKDTVLGFFHVSSKPDEKGQRYGIAELKQAIG